LVQQAPIRLVRVHPLVVLKTAPVVDHRALVLRDGARAVVRGGGEVETGQLHVVVVVASVAEGGHFVQVDRQRVAQIRARDAGQPVMQALVEEELEQGRARGHAALEDGQQIAEIRLAVRGKQHSGAYTSS